jgi:hypothetical protein
LIQGSVALGTAFNETNAKEMEKIRHEDKGLAIDMRGEITE